jgi:tripeptide aminopeptidase
MGAADVRLTDYGTVLATIPGTADGPTGDRLSGPCRYRAAVQRDRGEAAGDPRLQRRRDQLSRRSPLTLSPDVSPYLAEKLGHDIVTASGTTLLGADDKAGVAVIMTAARHLLAKNPAFRMAPSVLPSPRMRRSAAASIRACPPIWAPISPIRSMAARWARSNMKASRPMARWSRIKGVSIHPGLAKGKMVNAIHLAAKIIATLPQATMLPK